MKKVIMLLMLLLGVASAEESMGYTCSDDMVKRVLPYSMDIIGGNQQIDAVYDIDTVDIDHKNKIVKVWVTYISKPSHTLSMLSEYGEAYRNLGYAKQYKVFNMKAKKVKITKTVFYTCDGAYIDNVGEIPYSLIAPNSIDDTTMKTLKAHYKI